MPRGARSSRRLAAYPSRHRVRRHAPLTPAPGRRFPFSRPSSFTGPVPSHERISMVHSRGVQPAHVFSFMSGLRASAPDWLNSSAGLVCWPALRRSMRPLHRVRSRGGHPFYGHCLGGYRKRARKPPVFSRGMNGLSDLQALLKKDIRTTWSTNTSNRVYTLSCTTSSGVPII
jgi:hypothetical protein